MRLESLTFLETLVNTPSPTGHEHRGQRVWLDYARQFADETFSDAYGNCVARIGNGRRPRIMLAAHADEIAMAVNYITEDGFIHVRRTDGDEVVDGKSIMQMLLLAATQGTEIEITCDGEGAETALAALVGLVQRKFDEE